MTEKPTETFPCRPGEISAMASAHAPILYFDGVPFFAHAAGIAMIALTAQRQMGSIAENRVATDHAVVAHVRCNLLTLRQLRDAINGVLGMAEAAADALPAQPHLGSVLQ